MRLAAIVMLVCLAGCPKTYSGPGPYDPGWVSPSQQRSGHATPKATSRRTGDWASHYVYAACPKGKVGPGVMRRSRGHYVEVARCGFLVDEIDTDSARQRFIVNICGEDPAAAAVPSPECSTRQSEMVFARLAERYNYADGQWLTFKCKAYPERCLTRRGVEALAMESHNAGVKAVIERKAQEAARQEAEARRVAESERQESNRRFWGAVAAGLQGAATAGRPSLTCTTLGVTTTCR